MSNDVYHNYTCPSVVDDEHEVYHNDPYFNEPTLSASIAKILIGKSPFHAWLHHPRLGRLPREASDDMDRGTIIHNLVLGGGPDLFVIQAPDFRTKDARAHRDAAVARGELPVLEHKYDEYRLIADHIADECLKQGVSFGVGENEKVLFWEEQTDLGKIKCRAKVDNVLFDRGLIHDLKTTDDAGPAAIERTIERFGYDIQAAAYLSALRRIQPEIAGREKFVWVFVEELPAGAPRRALVNLAFPSGTMLERGSMRWKRACELWAKCLRDDHWPAYEACMVDPPGWAMKDEIGGG